MEAGDIVTEINGEPISDFDSVIDTIRSFEPGDEIILNVYHTDEDEAVEIDVILGENPEVAGQAYLGVHIGGLIQYEFKEPGQNPINPFRFNFRFPWQDGTRPRDRIAPLLGEEA